MDVNNHGGRCCGIKHIYGFDAGPNDKTGAINKQEVSPDSAAGDYQNPGRLFYPGPAPMETRKERLKRILDYIDAQRPNHLIEIALIEWQVLKWKATLEEFGFKQYVPECKNSNSGNYVTLFHRLTGARAKKAKTVKTTSLRGE